ncbi:hypothetical protein [Hymenobacter metallilatus]|uniref:Uncharacterized protein n=1 Tax=Hymenobacter metallilatus TaxID=2493666 RepID=A0A428JMX4_9BACT|nr:hypothetical protein [Hymenobacter metallilatus]RSK34621.1 hypothetical protein EI290_08330 [Hymenobacter metallilatus]
MTISITYLTDDKGRRKAVQIPYAQWQALQKELETVRQEAAMRARLTEAFRDIADMEAGRTPKMTFEQFLDELDQEEATLHE